MAIPNYSRVQLISSGHTDEGVPQGSIGYVIEVHDGNQYEVEFSDPATGVTFAQIVAPERALVLV